MIESLDLGAIEAVAAAAVLVVASAVRGYSGFGFSAVLVAGLSFLVDPVQAVSLAIGLEVLASIVQGASVRNDVEWQRLGVLVLAAIAGNPIGVEIVTTLEADLLRAGTFIILAVLTVGLLVGRSPTIPATLPAFFVLGVVAGIVNGATAMSGLVLVWAMSALDVAPAKMRGTLVAYFLASDLVALGVLARKGELDALYGWRIAVAVPIMVAGVWIGSRAFEGTSVESFKRVTLGLLLAISVVGLARLVLT